MKVRMDMFEPRIRRGARVALPLLMMLVAGVAELVPGALSAQTPSGGQESGPPDEEAPIEWNFRPGAGAAEGADVTLEERWAAPFAVISQGRPAPRTPREVVVLRDSVAARRVAVAQAASGQAVAEVTLEEDGAAAGGAGEAAPGSEGTGGEAAAGVDEDGEGDAGADEGGGDGSAPGEAGPEAEPGTETPARAASAGEAPSASSAATARTHRVEYGETWFGLAREYRVSSRDLAAANADVDPERLQAGTVLRIPAAGSADAAPRRHTVTRGDTLFGIARRYGVTPAAIRSANRLQNDVVRLGQTLMIPPEEASR